MFQDLTLKIGPDNPINQTLLSTFMRKKKIKYDVAKNGEEAVEKWQSGRFHLILVRLALPIALQALSHVRAHGSGRRWIFKCLSWTASPRPRRSVG